MCYKVAVLDGVANGKWGKEGGGGRGELGSNSILLTLSMVLRRRREERILLLAVLAISYKKSI